MFACACRIHETDRAFRAPSKTRLALFAQHYLSEALGLQCENVKKVLMMRFDTVAVHVAYILGV